MVRVPESRFLLPHASHANTAFSACERFGLASRQFGPAASLGGFALGFARRRGTSQVWLLALGVCTQLGQAAGLCLLPRSQKAVCFVCGSDLSGPGPDSAARCFGDAGAEGR